LPTKKSDKSKADQEKSGGVSAKIVLNKHFFKFR